MLTGSLTLIGAGIAVATGLGAGLGIGIATAGTTQAMARQPEMAGKLTSTFLLGCALAESTAIYGLVVSLVLLFK